MQSPYLVRYAVDGGFNCLLARRHFETRGHQVRVSGHTDGNAGSQVAEHFARAATAAEVHGSVQQALSR